MSRDPLPEPWRTALESKGISSKRGLASKAGISPQTAKRLIDGEGSPSHETVTAVADALFGGDRDRVWGLAGIAREDHGDWQIPPSLASQLNPEQRDAVLAVVRAMVPPESRRGDGDAHADERSAAPMKLAARRQKDLTAEERRRVIEAARTVDTDAGPELGAVEDEDALTDDTGA